MPQVEFAWGEATARGQREENQDRAVAVPPVFAVADGMGGHAGGSAAAEAVVASLTSLAGRPAVTLDGIRLALQRADGEIRAFRGPETGGAGTTVAGMAVVEEDGEARWAVFHVGDSRVYRWSSGELQRVTTDHSVVQELIDAGHLTDASAGSHPQRHIITRALGVGVRSDADVTLLPVADGDLLLACSDGLSGELDDGRIAELLAAGGDPQELADRLVAAAVEVGARDNVTVVVVGAGPGGRAASA